VSQYDTSTGGPARPFPTTVWSDILAAGDPAHPAYRESLDRLFRMYWKPVYAFIRASWRKPNEDAKDLTQAFFTRLLEKMTISRMRPERGSFRGYLKIALNHFVIDAERHDAVRRPPGTMFELDARPEELEPPAPGLTPEQAYDREWFRCLLAQAVDGLRVELVKDGKEGYWDAFRMYCLEPAGAPGAGLLADEPPEGPTYSAVSRALRVSETEVRHYLAHSRGALRRLLRQRIRDYTMREEDVDPELAQILRT
jgi:RNA polymerase sigma factor (sigma-70 family)